MQASHMVRISAHAARTVALVNERREHRLVLLDRQRMQLRPVRLQLPHLNQLQRRYEVVGVYGPGVTHGALYADIKATLQEVAA